MSFNFHELGYVVTVVCDAVSMLTDDEKVSISTVVESNDNNKWIVFNLSFSLNNGFAEISIGDSIGSIKYYNQIGELLKKIEFNDKYLKEIVGSFNLGLKEIIFVDKQTESNKSASDVLKGNSEMDKLRTQLSGIS